MKGLLGFNIMYLNSFTYEYDVKRVYFVSCRLRNKIYLDALDALDYSAQLRAIEGICTRFSTFNEPCLRLVKSCIGY